jgi:hypothetical protein
VVARSATALNLSAQRRANAINRKFSRRNTFNALDDVFPGRFFENNNSLTMHRNH